DLPDPHAGGPESFVDDGSEPFEMTAGGEFGDDAAVAGMEVDLRGHHIRPQAAVREDGGRCLITGRLNAEHAHRKPERTGGSGCPEVQVGAVFLVPLLEELLPEVPGPHDNGVLAVVAVVRSANADVLEPVLPVQI